MGAIVASAFVTIVAIAGVLYFNHQEKKENQERNDNPPQQP